MTASGFPAGRGAAVVRDLVRAIQDHRQELSDLDGALGDGDHGVNMAKGFTKAGEALAAGPGDLASSFGILAATLMTTIGGAMGPLYGMLFRGLSKGCEGASTIDAAVVARMLVEAEGGLRSISHADVGDKTLMDAFLPAVRAYRDAQAAGRDFAGCLEAMTAAAERGRDATRDLVARIGRASRLGERSRGSIDPGSASCALLLRTMALAMTGLLEGAGDA